MARGKYAEKAANRQAELAASNDLASYQHRVARLTAENRELRERLATQERSAKQTERRLRAERDEGVAPQVEALRLAHAASVEERDRARAEARQQRELRIRAAVKMSAHMASEHGMTLHDAQEWYYRAVSGADDAVFVTSRDDEFAVAASKDEIEYEAIRQRKAGNFASRLGRASK